MRRVALTALLFSTMLCAAEPKYKDPNLPAEERARDLVAHMSLAQKVSQMQNRAAAIPELGIPAYDWWNEALHGVARAGNATVFPQAIGLAATWDTDLEHRIADTISTEARAKYNDSMRRDVHGRYHGLTFWSPNINIFRDPRWGRGQETYGEDPYLTSEMAIAFIKGMQGSDPHYFKTIATSKHFAVHSGPEISRHQFDVDPSDFDLQNTYLPAFQRTVEEAKVDSIMCAYNAIDGKPACAQPMLLQKYLRQDWKFNGYVVSDCGAIEDIYAGHHYAKSLVEAAAEGVKAGTDLSCGTEYSHLPDAVQQGLITEKEIDESVVRLFTARFQLGMVDPSSRVPFSDIGMNQVSSPEHQKLALEAAEKSMVLLKNDNNTLPLEHAPASIAVVGPAADDPDAMLGNYNGIPSHIVTPLAGIKDRFQPSHVDFAVGSMYVETSATLIPASATGGGLQAQYFNNADMTGSPALTRTEPRLYFYRDMNDPAVMAAVPGDTFSVRWTGTVTAPDPGDYKIGFTRQECDNCSGHNSIRIYIDDKLAVETSGRAANGNQTKTAPVHFDANESHNIRVEYSQTQGGSGVELVWTPPADATLTRAIDLVKQSDIAIAVLGLNSRLEGEESPIQIPGFDHGDRTDIALPAAQHKLLEAVLATGKPTVVVLVNGSALAVNLAQEKAAAVLEAWYGGEEGGTAVAETLAGTNNPAGRLPVTFYRSVNDLPPFTDYSMKGRTYRYFKGDPLFAFGYGLSYSSFEYSQTQRSSDGAYEATVRNTSNRVGDEVAQLYVGDDPHSIQLAGFRRLHLKAGESQTVRFNSDQKPFAVIGGSQPK